MPPSIRKASSTKSQQSKLTDAFKAGGTRITKPTVGSSKPIKPDVVKRVDSITLLKSSPPAEDVKNINLEDEQLKEEESKVSLSEGAVEDVKIPRSELVKDEEEEVVEEQYEDDDFVEKIIPRQVVLPVEVPHEQEVLARQTTDKQIKQYYADINSARAAPPGG